MPTYDYKCSSCGESFEIFHSMSDSPKIKCPSCGKNTLKKQLGSGSGIIFKGTGFYQTDFKNKGAKNTSKPADSKT